MRLRAAPRTVRWSCIALMLALASAGAACANDGTGPRISLVGVWDFIGFTDAGVTAATTGTWTFTADGSLAIDGTVTFPGEAPDTLVVMGAYVQQGRSVELLIGSERGTWALTGNSQLIELTAIEPPPANTVTLRRR